MPEMESIPPLPKSGRKKRSSHKLLYLLLFFFVMLLSVLFFQSSVSKISEIRIQGLHWLSEEQVRQSAGIAEGDHFFGVTEKTLAARVQQLDIAESVQVRKTFPGIVNIVVEESREVAFQLKPNGEFFIILSNGVTVPMPLGRVVDKPVLAGWDQSEASMKQLAKLCSILGHLTPTLIADISEIRPDATVSYPDRIKMYTRSRHEVITTIANFPKKVQYLQDYIYELKSGSMPGPRRIIMLEMDYSQPLDS